MSKGKYLSILSCQIEAIVFIFLQIFFATRAVLKLGEYPWGIFNHVTRLDHSCNTRSFETWRISLGHIQSRDAFRPLVLECNPP